LRPATRFVGQNGRLHLTSSVDEGDAGFIDELGSDDIEETHALDGL
jgi:hypothetical protein